MHQHEDIRPTTEDIAGTDAPHHEIDRDDVDRTELGRAEMDRAKADRDNLGQDNLDRDDFGRNDADRHGIGDTETGRTDADSADTYRTGTSRTDTYRDEADRDRLGTTDEDSVVEVDETARPTDTTLADSNLAGSNSAGSNLGNSDLTGAQGSAGASESHTHGAAARENVTDVLFDEGEATRFQERWREVQAQFVDDPKQAVQDADVLVAELMQTLAAAFSERKRLLEQQWREGSETETEDLRLTLRGYRSFLDQLLTH